MSTIVTAATISSGFQLLQALKFKQGLNVLKFKMPFKLILKLQPFFVAVVDPPFFHRVMMRMVVMKEVKRRPADEAFQSRKSRSVLL